MAYVSVIYPTGFKIRSIADAALFCTKHLQKGSFDIPDADDSSKYYRLMKDEHGVVLLGSAHYGKDALMAEVPFLDSDNIASRIYHIRKSVNRHFFEE